MTRKELQREISQFNRKTSEAGFKSHFLCICYPSAYRNTAYIMIKQRGISEYRRVFTFNYVEKENDLHNFLSTFKTCDAII